MQVVVLLTFYSAATCGYHAGDIEHDTPLVTVYRPGSGCSKGW